MFCPNCGTKNEQTAQRCRQCGLELGEKKAAPKFKGTMMMGNSPFAGMQPGGAPGAGVPGTPAGGAAAPAGATPPAAPAKAAAFKGTMVGVAPPSLGATAPAGPSATPAAGPSQTPPAQAAPAPAAKAALKGPMIGVAPQGFGKPAAGAAPAAGPAPGGPAAAAGATPSAPPAEASAAPSKVSPKLKGTMIGVAPQGFNPAALAAGAATPAASAEALGKTEPPPPPEVGTYGATEALQQSDEVNPLGGTMLGATAPGFIEAAQEAAQGVLEQQSAAQPGEGAAYMATQPNPAYTPPHRQPTHQEPSAAAELGMPAGTGALATTAGSHGPIGKDRNPVATLLLAYVTCGLYGLIALVQMLGELREFRQKNDISILMFFIPIINIIEIWKLPEKVAQAQRMAGIENPQVAHPVLYLFFGLYFLPADLNETWAAARRNIG